MRHNETKPDCYCTLQDLKDLNVLPYGWVMIRRSVGGVTDLEDFEIKILGGVDPLAENAKLKRENEAFRYVVETVRRLRDLLTKQEPE